MNQQHDSFIISKRHNTRSLAVSVMYSLDLQNKLLEEENKNEILEETLNDVLVMSQTEFLSDLFPTLFSLDYLKELASKTYFNIKEIDEIICSSLVKYTIDRLSYVDRAIIRVAVAEMLIGTVAKNIIIDEALELTKELTSVDSDKQVKFNNRLLDSIAGKVYGN